MAGSLLVVHYRRDRETPWEDGERYSQLWPATTLLSTEGLGHNRLLDDSAVMDEALRFFARQWPAAPPTYAPSGTRPAKGA